MVHQIMTVFSPTMSVTISQLSARSHHGSTWTPIRARSPVKCASGAAAKATPKDRITWLQTSTAVGGKPRVSRITAGPMVRTRRTAGEPSNRTRSFRIRAPAWVPTTAEPIPEASSPMANTQEGQTPTSVASRW